MSQSPTFSVVIPLYNRQDTIAAAIASVQAQTYQNFEIIVVDDGSTDNPGPVIKALNEPRLQLVRQVNAGASAARNKGASLARGQFIAFLDSDDIFLPHHLAQALPVLTSAPNVCTYTQVIVNRGQGITFLKPSRGIKPAENMADYIFLRRGFIPSISLIVPTKLFLTVKYTESVSYGDDVEIAVRLAAAGGKFTMLQQPAAMWDDSANPTRLSNNAALRQREMLLASIEPYISQQVYWAFSGNALARSYAQQGQRGKALYLFSQACLKQCYSFKSACMIFLQIICTPAAYRNVANHLANIGLKP